MTDRNEINTLKTLAKRFARANRLPLHEALDRLARELEFSHWKALAIQAKVGWIPSEEQLASAEALVARSHPSGDKQATYIEQSMSRPTDQPVRQGKIGEEEYRVFEACGDIRMEGQGWRIRIGEAQFSQPIVEIEKAHTGPTPVNERKFLDAAMVIAEEEAAKVRAGISSDWKRRSTKPDAEGRVVHPLFDGRSADWFCLHCDSKITGTQIAENLWHCPSCGASPIDIFASPFWLEGSDVEPKPIQSAAKAKRLEPRIEIVDSRLTLSLNAENISMLLRMALLEDAKTPGERLAALLAEIGVDDEGDAWIALDEDLWPGGKEPEEAFAVAEMLGVELDLSGTLMTSPFAWPDLGHLTSSTRDYVQALLDAYGEHGVVIRQPQPE